MFKISDFLNHLLHRPSIDEPSWINPFTAIAFGGAGLLCLYYAFRLRRTDPIDSSSLQLFYASQALLLLMLGVNKQTGFLNQLTMLGRMIALRDGWYNTRHSFQFDLIGGIILASFLFLLLTGWYFRPILRHHWLSLLGGAGLLGYVAIRTVSLHAVDEILFTRVLGLRWDWIFELGGVLFLCSSLSLGFYGHMRSRRAGRVAKFGRGFS